MIVIFLLVFCNITVSVFGVKIKNESLDANEKNILLYNLNMDGKWIGNWHADWGESGNSVYTFTQTGNEIVGSSEELHSSYSATYDISGTINGESITFTKILKSSSGGRWCSPCTWAGSFDEKKGVITGSYSGEQSGCSGTFEMYREFCFAHITDPHLKGSDLLKINFIKTIKNIRNLIPKPDFLVVTGDIAENGQMIGSGMLSYLSFNSILDRYKLERYCCPGNHDRYAGTGLLIGTLKNYHKYIDSKDRYNFKIHNTMFFSLDSGWDVGGIVNKIIENPPRSSGLQDDDIEWIDEKIDMLDGVRDHIDRSGLNKIIFMHHPIINYGAWYKLGDYIIKKWDIGTIYKNREEFMDLCDQYEVDLVLTGHTHSNVIYKRSDDGQNINGQQAPIECFETLYVQTGDTKDHRDFRIITVSGDKVTVSKENTVPFFDLDKSIRSQETVSNT